MPSRVASNTWQTPPQGTFKLNWDAALDGIHCKVGIGAVIRDWEGNIKATLRMSRSLFSNPLLAEAVASLQVIIFCQDFGYTDIIMEGVSLQVVQELNNSLE